MKTKNNWLLFLLLTILFTLPAVFSLLYHPFFTFHDETQIVNMHQFFKTLDLGQFPPRWGLDFHFNYGSPFPAFYYQLPYFLGYPFHLAGFSLVATFKILLILGFFVAALGVYFLGLQLTTPFLSLVAAVIYTYTPYRAVASFVRGSLGESFALALFPWVFLFTLRLFQKPNLKRAVLAGLSWSALILTHQLATVFFIPLLLGLSLFLLICNRRLFFPLITTNLIALSTSAFYLLPLLVDRSLIKPSSPFNFYDHFPFLKQLIYSPWGYRASVWGIDDGLSFQLGLVPLFLLVFIYILTIFKVRRYQDKLNRNIFLYLLLAFPATIALMNIRTSFFWDVFPFTQLVQFPWRLLMITTFLVPVIFLLTTPLIPKKLFLPLGLFLLVASPLSTIRFFQPGEIYDRDDNYYLHRYLPNQAQGDEYEVSSAYLEHTEDYVSLPLTATRPTSLPDQLLTAKDPDTRINILDDNPFHTRFQVYPSNQDTLTLHRFAYPNWHVYLDDQSVKYNVDDLGLITFDVPSGSHFVTLKFEKTPLQQLSDLVTLVGLSVSFLLLFLPVSKKQTKSRTKS